MADYKVPNLCGASDPFNALQSKFDDMINTAASPAGLIADAAALATSLTPNVTSLLEEVESMLPELPTLPDVNLQAELTSLSGLSAGSFAHGTLLAEITTKFGTALSAGGFSIDTLVDTASNAVSGIGDGDICGGIPNFTIPAAGGTAVEKAVGVKQADVNSLIEEASILVENDNFTAAKTAVEETFTSYEEIGEEVPTEDIGPYRVTEEITEIVVSDNQGGATTIEATTAVNAAAAAIRSNVAPKGFTRRIVRIKEYILIDDVSGSGDLEFTLKNTPISISNVRGFDPNAKSATKVGRWRHISKPTSTAAGMDWSDSWTLDGQTITVTSHVRDYDTDPKSGYMFKVKYKYLDNYDPNFAGPI